VFVHSQYLDFQRHISLVLFVFHSKGYDFPVQCMTQVMYETGLNTVKVNTSIWGRRGRDRKVVGFTTTYPISAYHH